MKYKDIIKTGDKYRAVNIIDIKRLNTYTDKNTLGFVYDEDGIAKYKIIKVKYNEY